MAAEGLLVAQVLASGLMAGVLWIVQVVHYPLFARVGASEFGAYERSHQRRITMVVGPLMLVEAVCAVLLVASRPEGVPVSLAAAGLALVAVLWALTFFVSVPLHARLEKGLDARAVRLLVLTNWPRTIGWSARFGLSVWMVMR